MKKSMTGAGLRANAPLAMLALLSFLYTLAGMQPAWAKVTLSKLFVDNGIIQRDKPVNVFGTAKPGEMVHSAIGESRGVCIVPASGNFFISMAPPTGEGPFNLKVAGENLVEIKNLKLGEVWIVAGDADMDKDTVSGGKLPDSADMPPALQLFKVATKFAHKPVRLVDGHWIRATESGALAFSALGLEFGRDLAKQVGGPIGIIQVTCPDTPIRSWISTGTLLSKPETAGAANKANMSAADFDKLTAEYDESIKSWQASMTEGKEPTPRPLPSPLLRNSAGALFNGMIAPLTPYSVRGVVWAHGRSDLADPVSYKPFLSAFLKDTRAVFRQEGLPIILVQTGALGTPQNGDESPISVLRHQQYKARLAPRTYMAVSLDKDQVDKKTGKITTDYEGLAQRITNIALSSQYHNPIAVAAPIIDTVEKAGEGEALKLHLRYADGLAYSGKGNIKGFTVSSWNRQYHEAEVQLEGNTIVVQSKFVKDPKFVRYCWGNAPTINLYNKNNLPLVPYTSDR